MEQLFGCWNGKTNKECKINLEEKFTLMEGGARVSQGRNKRLKSPETQDSGGNIQSHARLWTEWTYNDKNIRQKSAAIKLFRGSEKNWYIIIKVLFFHQLMFNWIVLQAILNLN